MSFELDPREVLMHLHELGYYNISPEQLEEFIKDLKRLIKYDMAKQRRKTAPQKPSGSETNDESEVSSTLPNTTEESRSPSPPRAEQRFLSKHRKHCCAHSGKSSCREPPHISRSSSESSVGVGRTVLRECERYGAQKSQERVNVLKDKRVEASKTVEQPKPKSCDCNWRTIGCKSCDENWSKEQNSMKAAKSKENLTPRPKSFIRTWKATGQSRPGSASQRCDPVNLYHQYQQYWKHQKLPGENNHNDLRWTIREKMLGQEPQPRSRSCVCNDTCPCKLKEIDFSKNPKKVRSQSLPRGPFKVDGCIEGPLLLNKEGKFVMGSRHLQGTFELTRHSACRPEGETTVTHGPVQKSEMATWLSREEIAEMSGNCEKGNEKTIPNKVDLTQEEMTFRRANHDQSSCRYCCFIDHMFKADEPSTRQNSPNGFWHHRFGGLPDDRAKPCGYENFLKKGLGPTNKSRDNSPSPCVAQKSASINNKPNPQYNVNCAIDNHYPTTYDPRQYSVHNDQGLSKNHFSPRYNKNISPQCIRRIPTNYQPSVNHNLSSNSPPQQFTVNADVHRADSSGNSLLYNESQNVGKCNVQSQHIDNSQKINPCNARNARCSRCIADSFIPSSASTPTKRCPENSDGRRMLNLALSSYRNQRHRRAQKNCDNYCKATVPITLKDFKGEVSTEIEIFNGRQELNQRNLSGSSSSEPFFMVATEPLSQASSLSAMNRRQKWL